MYQFIDSDPLMACDVAVCFPHANRFGLVLQNSQARFFYLLIDCLPCPTTEQGKSLLALAFVVACHLRTCRRMTPSTSIPLALLLCLVPLEESQPQTSLDRAPPSPRGNMHAFLVPSFPLQILLPLPPLFRACGTPRKRRHFFLAQR